jgi:hypothetical protein
MQHVYVVQHSRSLGEEDQDTKFIGVYTSEQRAEEAVARARTLPGFRDTPDAFFIDKYALDKDYWAEGFISVP